MIKVSIAEARNQFTKLINAVEKGERVTVCRHGKEVADIIQSETGKRQRPKYGTLAGQKVILDPDWARPQNDVEAWLRGDV